MTDTKPAPVKSQPQAEPTLPKVWITKYALTTGVYTAENVRLCGGEISRTIAVPQDTTLHLVFYVHKPHWHETEDEARAQVQKMVNAALKSLRKKRDKLDAVMAGVQGPVPTKAWGA